jgi:hypothetical protein
VGTESELRLALAIAPAILNICSTEAEEAGTASIDFASSDRIGKLVK